MAGDEEVVFMNSPLYEHLTDIGFTDFKAETLLNQEETHEDTPQKREDENGYFIARFITEATNIVGGLFSSSVLQRQTTDVLSTRQLSCVSVLKESGLLTDDDLELVYRFEQCTDIFGKSEKLGNIPQRSTPTDDKFYGIYLLLFVTALAIFVKLEISYYTMVTFMVLAGILVAMGYKTWYHIDHQYQSNLTTINLYLESTRELLVLVRKAILFIQEKELLHHGHIFINSKISEKKLTKNTISSCPVLRQCLLSEVKTHTDVLQDKITSLSSTQFFKDAKSLTWLQKYLTNRNHVSVISESEVSLTNLKEVREYLVNSQSTFLCYVILKCYSMCLNKSGCNVELIQDCFQDLLQSCEDIVGRLQCCYKFHKVEIPGRDTVKNPESMSERVLLVSSIHSMTLHLQELCRLSVKIEERTQSTGNTSVEDHILENQDEFKDNLSSVKQHLDNITILWEDSCNRLCEMVAIVTTPECCYQKTAISDEREASSSSAAAAAAAEEDIKQQDSFQNPEATIPDEIFEGDTIFDRSDTHVLSSQSDFHNEEKALRESRYLLQELKSVLATRGDEKMVSIPRVLLTKKHGDLSDKQDEIQSTNIDLIEEIAPTGLCCVQETQETPTPEAVLQSYDRSNVVSDLQSGLEHSHCVTDCGHSEDPSSVPEIDHGRFSTSSEEERENINRIDDKTLLLNPLASMVAKAAMKRNKTFDLHEQIICED